MKLFRAMREAVDGRPEVGRSARLLGVRPGDQPTFDVKAIKPTDLVRPGEGGMSAATDPLHLPRVRRPASLSGLGLDPVWYIEDSDLHTMLQVRRDSQTHLLIEPGVEMTLSEFEDRLAATRTDWKLHCR
jgi:hypothetical protein